MSEEQDPKIIPTMRSEEDPQKRSGESEGDTTSTEMGLDTIEAQLQAWPEIRAKVTRQALAEAEMALRKLRIALECGGAHAIVREDLGRVVEELGMTRDYKAFDEISILHIEDDVFGEVTHLANCVENCGDHTITEIDRLKRALTNALTDMEEIIRDEVHQAKLDGYYDDGSLNSQ